MYFDHETHILGTLAIVRPRLSWINADSIVPRLTNLVRCAVASGIVALSVAMSMMTATPAAAGPSYDLRIATEPGQLQRLCVEVDLEGQLKLNPTGGEITRLPIHVQAKLEYDEKLIEIDRVRQQRRSVRYYHRAQAEIQIGRGRLESRLSDSRRIVVAQADKGSSLLFSPVGPLTRNELDLINVQGNSVLLDSLLPQKSIAIGDTWQHDNNALAQLLGWEVISRSDVTSQLVGVDEGIAFVETSGVADGAVGGVSTQIKLKAKCKIDLGGRRILSLTLDIEEDRSIGHAEPGFNVRGQVQVTIQSIDESTPLAEKSLADLQIKHSPGADLLRFESSVGGFRLMHDRRWRVMTDQREVTILRFVDRGDLIAQCNISRLPDLPPGQHLPIEDFRKDIQRSLDKHFGQFLKATESTTDSGLRVLRVVAAGEVSDLPIVWTYYHISNEKGYRAAYVFTLEGRLSEQFADADSILMGSLELLRTTNPDADQSPAPASTTAPQQSANSAGPAADEPVKR